MGGKPILDLNAFDYARARDAGGPLEERLRQRARLFGAASVLFYDRPLELVRGAGCWLYDAAGVAYLDAYNNVPSVGHCHPRVVEAAARQLGELNVHNRYLHPEILSYAERLLATFPAELSNITFTCTGSESNDLALRLAATVTRARGVIVTQAAYHGNTALVTRVSPTVGKHPTSIPEVRYVPAPHELDVSADAVGECFATHVAAAIADLARDGVGLSALLIDSIFSSDGVCADPPGLLGAAVDVVHGAQGLVIADEVQSGFGRTGASWWGFERHGVRPDIVTLGKPMGNGYPVGAVIMRPAILEAYCTQYGYFNTFAASPVAAAVGQAVLTVIEEEGLIENAARVGGHLRRGLVALAARHERVGAVRGAGLYVGVDLPSAELAASVINALRERRVLIGAAGKFGNTLKIRPPLCFSAADADVLVSALDDALLHAGRG
jgi:4-aminobutyrate aminotransferase-like enzyme